MAQVLLLPLSSGDCLYSIPAAISATLITFLGD
jgi:hypothetical protein